MQRYGDGESPKMVSEEETTEFERSEPKLNLEKVLALKERSLPKKKTGNEFSDPRNQKFSGKDPGSGTGWGIKIYNVSQKSFGATRGLEMGSGKSTEGFHKKIHYVDKEGSKFSAKARTQRDRMAQTVGSERLWKKN
jgi:hypothetical protein